MASSACCAAPSSLHHGCSRPRSSTAPRRATAARGSTAGPKSWGKQDFKAQEAAAPGVHAVSAARRPPREGTAPSLLPASRMNCFRSSQPPACELLLPTQHFCHPLRETLPYFSFSSSQKFPEPLEVPISISASPWGILQMPENPGHPPAVGSVLRQGCAVQWLKGKTETPLLLAIFWVPCSRGHPVAGTTSRGPTGEEA